MKNNRKEKVHGAQTPPMPTKIPMPPVVEPPKHRISLIYKQDNTWDMYCGGEFLFNSESQEEVLRVLGVLMKILD